MKNELIDYDLDVMNDLKDFPKNEKDSFIYLRCERGFNDQEDQLFVHTCSSHSSMPHILYSFMKSNEDVKLAILNTAINALKEGTIEEREYFLSVLKD